MAWFFGQLESISSTQHRANVALLGVRGYANDSREDFEVG